MTQASGAKERILLVDDEQAIREMLAVVLQRDGYRVDQAENGAVALDHLAKEIPDLILLDLSMPVLDGFKTLERIRADQRLANVPVVILSGLLEQDDMKRGLSLGADEYLGKPIHNWELRARIGSLLKVQAYRRRVLDLERDRQKALQNFCKQVCLRLLNSAKELESYFTLVQERGGGASDPREIEAMHEHARNLVALLDRMADYSQLCPTPFEPVKLAEVLELARQTCVSAWTTHPGSIRIDVEGDLPLVDGRTFELGLAFSELLGRLTSSLPPGGHLAVKGERAGPGVRVSMQIPASAPGIADWDSLLEPPPGVTGPATEALDLSIVRTIFTDHRAAMDISRAPTGETAFNVTLPQRSN